MMRPNPIQAAREAKGITRAELALLAGADYALVYQAETGRLSRPSPAVLNALAKLGFDSAQLAADYASWRQAMAEEFLASKLAAAQ